jgi:hypothetical protein
MFVYAPWSADFWIQDLRTKADGFEADAYRPVKVVYPGTSHIHLFNEYTNIHSHEHNLNPEEKDKLRRFLVRCIKESN